MKLKDIEVETLSTEKLKKTKKDRNSRTDQRFGFGLVFGLLNYMNTQ